MKAIIYIPYANSDCVRGFKADKELKSDEYVKEVLDDYYSHRQGVDMMVGTRLGYNIAINNFQKRRVNVKAQTYKYNQCPCVIFDMDSKLETLQHLDEMYRTQKKFILIFRLNSGTMSANDDLCEDIRTWIRDSSQVKTCPEITPEQVLIHLPKKDLRIKIEEDGSNAVLKDCKLIDVMGKINEFAVLVDKVVFVKE